MPTKSSVPGRDKKLYDLLIQEHNHPFEGWDFSHITKTGRMVDGPLTWSYGSVVLAQIPKAESLLDIGTGGGELLASLRPLPPLTYATENYHPNVAVARKKLEPLGVKVLETQEDVPLPFEDGTFDLVIDRHESYSPNEVFRVIKPHGLFITQQVGSKNDEEIRRLLGARRFPPPKLNLQMASRQLKRAGFKLDFRREEYPIRRFHDIGALVYYLKAVPWVIPDFAIEKYFTHLAMLNKKIELEGYIEDRNHRFILVAQKLVH
jgi:protein-L-isoaspartate O-methyltransferase